MKRVEINTPNRSRIFAADSINSIEIEKDCLSGTKRLYLNINTTPFFVTCGEENIKNATDELKDVFEELEKFVFEPTNFSKMVINISEEKTIIEPAYAIVEIQVEHGKECKVCRNKDIKHTTAHSTDLYSVKVPFNDECDDFLKDKGIDMLKAEIGEEFDIDYAEVAERNDGVFKTSYIRDDFE